MHLLSLANVVLRATPAALGIGAAMIVAALDSNAISAGNAVTALTGAWLVLALGLWFVRRFDRAREVRLAVIGPPEIAASLSRELDAAGVRGYRVCGWLGPAPAPGSGSSHREPEVAHIGDLDELRTAVKKHAIELLVNGPDPDRDVSQEAVFETVADACLDLPVRMISGGSLYEELLGHVPLGTIDSAWFACILHPQHRPHTPLSKRVLDVCLGSLATLFALPVIAVAGIAIKLTDGGPVFYRQRRVGERGREFTMLKLRTMRVDAEAGGIRLAAEDDERITRVGRLLRRSHIDELPQLLNVLRGEMALVGPRPERRQYVTALEREYRYFSRRHLIKPGITGWAQVTCGYAGTEAGVAWKLCHDLFYLRHPSMLADLLILTETVRTVFADVQYGVAIPDEKFIFGEAMT
jgi:exopolysaccharide biosynthesis polyprenyl glycosylphosphotransferase